MLPSHTLFVIIALLLIFSILMSKLAVKSRVPALLLFLLLGMLAGSEGIGGIYFDDPWLTQTIGVVALIFILFSGGLDTQWSDIRPVLPHGLSLSTLGVLMTAICVGAFAHTLLGFTLLEGLLLGAIIASTDAAAVFTVLRGQGVHLRGRLKPLLELESGSNDPMAVFLTIGMLQLIVNPQQPPISLLPLFIMQMGIGAAVGVLVGRVAVAAFNRVRLEYDGLYPVLSVALVLLIYGATSLINGNGFLAVYLTGLVMAQHNFIHKRSLISFHDGIAWLMQIAMFLTLGLQVFPSQVAAVAISGLWVAAFLIVIARPFSVLVALSFSRMKFRKKLFVAWVGLRGAAPIVLATFPLLAGIEKAQIIFNLVFFIVLTSVLVQGTLLVPAARLLKVSEPHNRQVFSPLAYVMHDGRLANDLIELTIPHGAGVIGRQIVELGLPDSVRIMLIGRDDDLVLPNGNTVIHAGDRLLLLSKAAEHEAIKRLLECEINV